MSEAQKLVACPLCGAEEGYVLSEGKTYRWWSVGCASCGQEVSEARATYPAEQTPRTLAADEAWNRAGSYAQGLRDRIAALDVKQAQAPTQAEVDLNEALLEVDYWKRIAAHLAAQVGYKLVPIREAQQAQAPGWQLSRVSDGDIRVYGPDKETWLIRKDCGEGFYDFIHRYFDAAIGAAPQQGSNT